MKIKEFKNRFKLFECTIPVRGAKRGIMYDLPRSKFDYVPLELINIVENFDGKSVQEVLSFYGKDNESTILEYFDFLLQEEYIFFTDLSKCLFPKLEIKHNKPYKISNLIIDVNSYTFSFLEGINKQMQDLGCESLLLRFLDNDSKDLLMNSLTIFKNASIKSLEIIIKETPTLNAEFLEKLCFSNMKIMKFTIFDGQDNEVRILKPSNVLFIRTKTEIPANSKHKVHLNNFMVNLDLFMESKEFNNYYYRKIFIDGEGKLKNSPECEQTFGNIKKRNILDVMNQPEFQKLWTVKKDSVLICKDCEYRYMCIDSTIPHKKGEFWELETNCDYDPFTAVWQTN